MQLLKWALHFAQGDQAQAEDLVQDTFVRFVVSERELKDSERIEPLLYTYLKYVDAKRPTMFRTIMAYKR
jgi:DNA-directed RNA polymerase specialized sigma24 family protein